MELKRSDALKLIDNKLNGWKLIESNNLIQQSLFGGSGIKQGIFKHNGDYFLMNWRFNSNRNIDPWEQNIIGQPKSRIDEIFLKKVVKIKTYTYR